MIKRLTVTVSAESQAVALKTIMEVFGPAAFMVEPMDGGKGLWRFELILDPGEVSCGTKH